MATATLNKPTAATQVSGRTADILAAAKNLIDEHRNWVEDPRTPLQPSLAFEKALQNAIRVIRNGDVPARCQSLWVATGRLLEEWNAYAGGVRKPDKSPTSRFWAAYESFAACLQAAKPRKAKRVEPVRELLDQKVSVEQIGRWIYGDGKTGPFIDENGQVDTDLIYQEASQPGSVIPADWVHPSEARALSDATAGLSVEDIPVLDRDGTEPAAPYIDKASIEQLMREGQFFDVIARVKGVTIDEVRAEGRRLGIREPLRPEWGGADVADDKPSDELQAEESPQLELADGGQYLDGELMEDAGSGDDDFTPLNRNESPAEPPDTGEIEAVDVRILQLWDEGRANLGAPEIAKIIGGNVNSHKVAAVIRQAKRRAAMNSADDQTGGDSGGE